VSLAVPAGRLQALCASGLTAGAKMKCCARSRWSTSKDFLSKFLQRIAVAVGCAALIFLAQPALAQRGGHVAGFAGGHGGEVSGHAGSGHSFGDGRAVGGERSFGGMRGSGDERAVHSVGERAHSEPHSGVQVFSGARPHAEPARVGAPSGIASYSGERARGESPEIRSYGGETGGGGEAGRAGRSEMPAGLRGFAGIQHSGGSMRAARGGQHQLSTPNAAAPVEPRHVTIGFPPSAGAWRLAPSQHHSGTLAFAGQGHAVWQTAPRHMPNRTVGGTQVARSRPAGEWQPPANAADHRGDRGDHLGRGDHDHFDRGDHFRHGFHRYDSRGGYGIFGYPLYGYGLGVWPGCEVSLKSDWYWLEGYDQNCKNAQPQDKSIVSYGADQSYGAPKADTQREYGPYAWQPPPSAAKSDASAKAESQQSGGSSQQAATPDTLIYLADGTNYAVTSYWLSGGDLHYVTSYGAENSVPIGQINLQRTVDANAAQGVQFTLRPSPGSDSGTTH
jgi:hypothetical protein